MSRAKVKDRVRVKLRPPPKPDWPDPPMVPSWALRRCERAQSLEEVRKIVALILTPKAEDTTHV